MLHDLTYMYDLQYNSTVQKRRQIRSMKLQACKSYKCHLQNHGKIGQRIDNIPYMVAVKKFFSKIRQQWVRGKIGTIRRRKDIGVFVDDNLPFVKFIQAQVDKTNRIMGLIRRTYTR